MNNLKLSQARRGAEQFFEDKLSVNPDMAKYNHCLAAIKDAHGDRETANTLYKHALSNDSGNVMIRNDLALSIARGGNIGGAVDEFKRAILINDQQPTLHKNLGAVYARRGQYREAHEHARRAVQINANDALSLRNLAKLKDAIGDSRSALPYYLKAIEAEQRQAPDKIHTAAYRAAAVQMIVQGVARSTTATNTEDAVALVKQARVYDKVHYISPTTEKTNEILDNIRARRGDILDSLEREAQRRKDALQLKEEVLKQQAGKYLPNFDTLPMLK